MLHDARQHAGKQFYPMTAIESKCGVSVNSTSLLTDADSSPELSHWSRELGRGSALESVSGRHQARPRGRALRRPGEEGRHRPAGEPQHRSRCSPLS